MVVDTSALVAIVLREPERAAFVQRIAAASAIAISAVSWMECRMVLSSRLREIGVSRVEALLKNASMQVIPATRDISDIAFAAFRSFGKGRHPAGLNFGDCFAYALAADLGAPLLYKGNDFARTDIVAALQ